MKCCFVFTILVYVNVCCATTYKNHYGMDFDLGMVPMYHFNPNITLDIASNETGKAKLFIPFFNINKTYSLNNGQTTIYINNSLIKRGNFTENRGVNVQTDVFVAVYVTLYRVGITESYLALPRTFTGKKYVISAFKPYPGDYSEVLIVSNTKESSSNVNISVNGETKVQSLNWLNSEQLVSLSDISGGMVLSNSSLSVIAGTTCSHVPINYTYDCGFLVEQMFPTNAWEKEYIVPNMPPRNGSLIRVVSENIGDVCFHIRNGSSCKQIPYPDHLEFMTGPEPVVVTSNSFIGVTSYGIEGGPFMLNVPGIRNFMNAYNFVVPSTYASYTNNIAIVAPTLNINGLLLDGITLTTRQITKVASPFNNYSVIISSVQIGYHNLTHTNDTVKFGAVLYGSGYLEGYGYPLGIQNNRKNVTYARNVCFNCEDMHHIELCNVVQRCLEHEICFLERFMMHGKQLFRSGCMDQQICLEESNGSDHDRCTECCIGNYCNHQGCGETGLPARNLRGPLCFDCEYVFTPEECDTLKLCDEGQLCRIEETKWGTGSNFKMGCAHGSCHAVTRSVVLTRSLSPICQTCCSEDFCNVNCTLGSEHGHPVIIG